MESEQLAAEVIHIVSHCSERILGIGHEQYSFGDVQSFEQYTPEEMERAILEEIEDTINHLVMLHIRVRRINAQANRHASRQ